MIKMTMFVATATLVAACGGGDGGGGGTGAVTADVAEDVCRQGCEHDFECDPTGETVEQCTTSCLDDVVGVIREDVFIAVTDCFTALECGVSDDACLAECEPTASHDAYEAACRSNLAECDLGLDDLDQACSVSPSPSSEDIGYFCVIAPAIIDELTSCFGTGTCQEQIDCVQAALEANGVSF